MIEKEVQTEELGEENKFNQAPEDIMANYNKDKGVMKKKRKDNETINLERFMQRAGPVME